MLEPTGATAKVINGLYDLALRRFDSHAKFYRGWYREEVESLDRGQPTGMDRGLEHKIYRQLLEVIEPIFQRAGRAPAPRRLIELGAGTGWLSCALASPELHVDLVDCEREATNVAERLAAREGKTEAVRVICDDMFAHAFEAHAYDVVYSIGVFEELSAADREALLSLGRRLTKPGGVFLIGVPNFASPVMIELWHRYGKANEVWLSRRALKRSLESVGFTDVRTVSAGPVTRGDTPGWSDRSLASWFGMLNLAWGEQPAGAAVRESGGR